MAKKTNIRQEETASKGVLRANVNREVVQRPDAVSLYINDTQIQLTPWDVCFTLGVVKEGPTNQRSTILIEKVGELRMSPQHAKMVALILIKQLDQYESNVGPIPLPPSASESVSASKKTGVLKH